MPGSRRILLVEDDADLRTTLKEILSEEHGYDIAEAGNIADADRELHDETAGYPDAIVLDIGLPDGDGCDYCARLRHAGLQMPILILTGAADEADVVRGLASGANDYIAKPFRAGELAARLHAQLRTFDNSEHAVFPLGPYMFSPSRKLLQDASRKKVVRLTAKEVSILRFLHRAPGAVNRDVLLAEVWEYNSAVTTHTLETHIYRLRQKIEADPASPTLLITEERGYRLEQDFPDPAGIR